MKYALSLPQVGNLASAKAIRAVAQHAEQIGYDSLWVLERTLKVIRPEGPIECSPGREALLLNSEN